MSIAAPAGEDGYTDPTVTMTGFVRALRANGVAADPSRLATALALTHIDALDARAVYWAGRVSLCAEPDDLPRYDALFDTWFRGALPTPAQRPSSGRPGSVLQLSSAGDRDADGDSDDEEPEEEALRTAASEYEALRQRDLAELTDAERDQVNELIAYLSPRVGRRRTRRTRPGGHHGVDLRRTVRRMVADGGEIATLEQLRPRAKPRRLVMLIDVSGSMGPYADVLLRFAHAAARVSPTTTEAFTLGTRLTRVSRPLRLRDPEQALRAAGTAIPDWSGGTRLGETLQAFLDRWGQRGTARGATVVLASDGWERGDTTLLGEQMQRLARLAHRVIWVNPHRGKSGFAPVTAGMTAALPHCDELLAGHTLDALHTLAQVIADA